MQAFLGIDIGTSAVKVLALREDGAVVASAKRSYPTKTPAANWAEQSPEDWWSAVAGAVREAVAAIGDVTIAGVGLSGQLNGFVLLGGEDRQLGDAIIWLDLRARQEANELQRDHGAEIAQISGNPVSPISVLAKLRWLARHRPDTVARARRLLLVKDYVLWRLTGAFATDPSDASATNLLDLGRRSWSAALVALAGVPIEILPPVMSSSEVAGRITGPAAAATGLAEGTPVVPGCGDVAALAVGSGVIEPGILGITLGTAGHVVLSGPPREPGTRGFWQIAHAIPGQMVWLGLVMAGGLSLAWLHRLFGAGRETLTFDQLAALSEGVEPGAGGVTFLPFLEGAATPYDRPDAKGSLHGLTSSHGAGEVVQAVMEGVAYNIRQCIDLFTGLGGRIDEVRLSEGGARVPRWCQIIADAVDRPVSVLAHFDTSALGAALVAQSGATAEPMTAVSARAIGRGRRFEPVAGSVEAYNDGFARYRAIAEREIGPEADQA
jgi:xylulokinase